MKASQQNLLDIAQQCVKCGLCLPHCPTYALYNKESESPRGRVAIAEALLTEQIQADKEVTERLEHCLQCAACERACPSHVRFVELIDGMRSSRRAARLARITARHPEWLGKLARLGQHAPGDHYLLRLNRALKPMLPAPAPGTYNPGGSTGSVALFLGCTTRSHQGKALDDALYLLTQLGFRVDIPAQQQCCGALAQHQGDGDLASRQMRANQHAFDKQPTILSTATACSAHLSNTGLSATVDLYAFLAQADWRGLSIAPLKARASVWVPCSQLGIPGSHKHQIELLEKIPALTVDTLDRGHGCCGAGGSQLLSQQAQAKRLREPVLQDLRSAEPDYLISSNIGCSLHLAEGLQDLQGAQARTRVIHPVSLLAQQVRAASLR